MHTLHNEPGHFYYYNNGISALCENFDFDEKTKKLRIKKIQIVNGAQTIGAIKAAAPSKLQQVLVLVKLTSIKRASKRARYSRRFDQN
jgi:AIPR protein